MTKPKRKSVGLLGLLFASIFCIDAVAVNNLVSYSARINDSDVIKCNGEYYINNESQEGCCV